jgi:hypothetical protein
MIEQSLIEETRDYGMTKEVIDILHEVYPGHRWIGTVQGGVVVVKNMDISETYGMRLHYENMGDAAASDDAITAIHRSRRKCQYSITMAASAATRANATPAVGMSAPMYP